MKKYTIYTIKDFPIDQTDFELVKKMSNREVCKMARTDPDALPLTKKQLAQFKRVHSS